MKQLARLDARIPSWDFSALVDRVCPFCGDAGTALFRRPDGLAVHRCGDCGVYFVAPAPGPAQLDAFYAHYNDRHRRLNSLSRETTMLLLAREPQSDLRMTELATCFPDTAGRRALDVGFGLGADLVLLHKLGFAVDGIELDDDALAYVRSHLGIAGVRRGMIDTVEGTQVYDAIVLHDLVEHPLEPLALLRRAAALLKPGGVLSLWTPNATFVEDEAEPVTFRVDLEHMQYLTLPSCVWIARALGLDVLHLESAGFPSLRGIEHAPAPPSPLKRVVKSLPGVLPWLTQRRLRAETAAQSAMRRGRYHLFCLMRKPPAL